MCKKICCKTHYVAFLDLLGAKDIIQKDVLDEDLNHIHNIYQTWYDICGEGITFNDVDIKMFSDNILIAVECDKRDALHNLCRTASYIVEHLIRFKYKVRGGITKGDLFIDSTMVWGKALVAAYKLESRKAVNPRIVVEQNVVGDIEKTYGQVKWLKKDDDYYVLDYLRFPGSSTERTVEKIDEILKALNEEVASSEKIKDRNEYFKKYLEETKSKLSSTKGKDKCQN